MVDLPRELQRLGSVCDVGVAEHAERVGTRRRRYFDHPVGQEARGTHVGDRRRAGPRNPLQGVVVGSDGIEARQPGRHLPSALQRIPVPAAEVGNFLPAPRYP